MIVMRKSNTIVQQLKDFLLGLRDDYGFAIDVGRLESALCCINDITDVEEVVYRLQSMICKDEQQIETFRNVFAQQFLGGYIKTLSKKKTEPKTPKLSLTDAQKSLASAQTQRKNIEQGIARIDSHIDELNKQIQQAQKLASISRDKLEEQSARLREEINELSPLNVAKRNPRMERQLNRIADKTRDSIEKLLTENSTDFPELASMKELHKILNSPDAAKKIRSVIDSLIRRASQYGQAYIRQIAPVIKNMSLLAELCNTIVGDISLKIIEQKQKQAAVFDSQKKEGDLQILTMRSELKQAQNRRTTSVSQLKKALQTEEDRSKTVEEIRNEEQLIIKGQSMVHRKVFTAVNARAVQTTAEAEELLSEPITQLSSSQMQMVSAYIRTNARAFRQTLRRNSSTPVKRRIDMRVTMRYATKTGGEPMSIKYKKPIKSHAKIVCLVDISGSCRQAASVALYFMALMDEAFPGGVHKFAFVNHLIPVDRYFVYQSASDAVQAVNANVPSRGIYSDYGATLHALREDYASLFGKDTTLIVIGDARNNKHNNHQEDVRFFCEKSRRVFWLNPDNPSKWGRGDSEASEYQKEGVDMRHIATVGDLLKFLSTAAN